MSVGPSAFQQQLPRGPFPSLPQVLARGDALPTADGRRGSLLTVRAERPRVIGSRQAFVRALLHLVEEVREGRKKLTLQSLMAAAWFCPAISELLLCCTRST